MILGTHRKTSNWRSRTAAAVMIIGAATLSAPLIQADAHPETEVSEEELAGKYSQHQGKSVIKRDIKVDDKTISVRYEVNVDGDDVTAYKIDPSGNKTRIDIEDIEGVRVGDILAEKIEGDIRRQITISDGEGDLKTWIGKMKEGKLAFHSEDGKRFELHNFPHPPKPPGISKFSELAENGIIIRSDTFEGLEGLAGLDGLVGLEALEGLKGLEGLEKLKVLKSLKSLKSLEKLESLKDLETLDGFETFTFFADDEDGLKLKMRLTESKLAAARAMLEDTEVEADDSREMAKAKRELEKARKALKAAEKALKEAE